MRDLLGDVGENRRLDEVDALPTLPRNDLSEFEVLMGDFFCGEAEFFEETGEGGFFVGDLEFDRDDLVEFLR